MWFGLVSRIQGDSSVDSFSKKLIYIQVTDTLYFIIIVVLLAYEQKILHIFATRITETLVM